MARFGGRSPSEVEPPAFATGDASALGCAVAAGGEDRLGLTRLDAADLRTGPTRGFRLGRWRLGGLAFSHIEAPEFIMRAA
jgi:hypothetical protein